MENLGRHLIAGGIVLIVLGGSLYVASRLGVPLGRLPGDVRIEGESGTFYFPIATSILISLAVTLVLNVVARVLSR